MHIPKIQAQFQRSRAGLKKYLPQKIIPQKIKQTAMKKILPSAMIAVESLTTLSGHAQGVNKSLITFSNYDPKDFEIFMPFVPKAKNEFLPPLGSMDFVPKNKFSKYSTCIKDRYKGSVEELNYFIEQLIPKRNGRKDYNPFYGKAQSFIDIGNKHNINPTVLIAIAMQESGRGTSVAAVKMKNIGGIYINNKHAKFENVEQCIEEMAKTIEKRVRENYNTIDLIGKSGKYCDKSVSNLWVKNVVFFLNKM